MSLRTLSGDSITAAYDLVTPETHAGMLISRISQAGGLTLPYPLLNVLLESDRAPEPSTREQQQMLVVME